MPTVSAAPPTRPMTRPVRAAPRRERVTTALVVLTALALLAPAQLGAPGVLAQSNEGSAAPATTNFAPADPTPPPPLTTALGAPILQSNSAMCASSSWNGTAAASSSTRSSIVMQGHPTCGLSAGCQRSLCTCLGVEFDATTTTCTNRLLSESGGRPDPPTNCAAVDTCTRNAVSCFQQAAVLTSQSAGCEAFSGLLYEHMILAAVGAPSALRADCAQLRCNVYNRTAKIGGTLSAYAACTIMDPASAAACPLPTTATIHLYLHADSWGAVLTDERRPVFNAALENDLATAVGNTASLSSVDMINATTLHARVFVAVDAAVPYVLGQVHPASGSTAWLIGTTSAYRSSGGAGEMAVFTTVNAPYVAPPSSNVATIEPPPAPSPTSGPLAPNATLDPWATLPGPTAKRIGDDDGGACGSVCQGAVIASVVVVAMVGAGAFVAYRLTRGPSTDVGGADGAAAAGVKGVDLDTAGVKDGPIIVRSRPPSAPPVRSTNSATRPPRPTSSRTAEEAARLYQLQQQQTSTSPHGGGGGGPAPPPPLSLANGGGGVATPPRRGSGDDTPTPHPTSSRPLSAVGADSARRYESEIPADDGPGSSDEPPVAAAV